ncbi:unnamed protein product, partial [Phaeothamnion confervicola]
SGGVGSGFVGVMDELFVYFDALTPSELDYLFQTTRAAAAPLLPVAGEGGYAIRLSGAQHLEASLQAAEGTTEATVSMWLRPEQVRSPIVSSTASNFLAFCKIGGFARGAPSQGSFVGMVDELQLWNGSTSASNSDRHSILTGSEENLLGYWRFQEGVGVIA